MEATKLLIADHNRVRGLFARYEAAHEADEVQESAALVSVITAELTVHMTIEEEVLYPAIREFSDELGAMVDEGVEEHHVAKVLLEEIQQLDPSDEVWVAKVKVLMESVEHHLDEEETDMFPKIRSSASAADRDALGDALDACKAALGAPTVADKLAMSKDELAEKAREQQIPGRSTMDHEELAATVGLP